MSDDVLRDYLILSDDSEFTYDQVMCLICGVSVLSRGTRIHTAWHEERGE